MMAGDFLEFEEFLKGFLAAAKGKDTKRLMEAYREAFTGSGAVPPGEEEAALASIAGFLAPLAERAPDGIEALDDYRIARFKDKDGSEISLTFIRKGDSWGVFDERMNLRSFKRIYAIGYSVEGEQRLGVLFNGKRSPILRDIGSSGFASLINSALKPGENELTITPLGGALVKVSIRISSGVRGSIMDSSQGDVLSWDGVVKEPVKLKFRAE